MFYSGFDQMGNRIELPHSPKRIVSLVPSQTELLYDLRLENEVVGITRFCVHPQHWKKSKTIIGGTKKFHIDDIIELQPDLVIGNKEENYEEGIQSLQQHFPVWLSDIINFEDALEMIGKIGEITFRVSDSHSIILRINQEFQRLSKLPPLKTLYLMWKNPWMGAGTGTFIHTMIEKTGLQNVLSKHSRYPELSVKDIKNLRPEVILLSTEPFPFNEKHIPEIRELVGEAKILVVDGEMFSWYGSRLIKAPAYLNSLQIGA